MKKVMITGIGMLTAVGNGKDATWEAVKAGKPGVGRITKFDPSRCTCQVAAEVKGFEEYAFGAGLLEKREARHMAKFSQYAVATANEAWRDAGYSAEKKPDMNRVATIFGVGIGGLEVTEASFKTLFDKGPDRLSPLAIPELIANEGAGNVAIALGAKGPCHVLTTACASSTDAIGYSMDLIRTGRADVVVAGGAEAVIIEFTVGGFMKEKALSTSYNDTPETACRPFTKGRDGFVMGEGAAVLILESEEHAKARGAKVYAELAGYGATCDAYHITAPDPSGEGSIRAIEVALADAGVTDRSTVDYINAHGTSTHLNDQMETKAFKTVFGEEGAKKIALPRPLPRRDRRNRGGDHRAGGEGRLRAADAQLQRARPRGRHFQGRGAAGPRLHAERRPSARHPRSGVEFARLRRP